MADRWNRTITDLGLNMLANVTDARALNIVRMACASGTCAVSGLRSQTVLTDEVMDIPIISSRQDGNIYRIEGRLDNTDIENGFFIRQIGVFARLGDNRDEVLFEIIQIADGDAGDRIPSYAESPGYSVTEIIDLVFSGDVNVTVQISNGSLEEIEEEISALDGRVKNIEDKSRLIFGNTIYATLKSGNWDSEEEDFYQDLDVLPAGVNAANVRGVIGLPDDVSDAAYQAAAKAKLFCVKKGNKLRVYVRADYSDSAAPDIDIPVALNLEYAGDVDCAVISAFPCAEKKSIKNISGTVYSGYAVIPAGKKGAIVEIDCDFESGAYVVDVLRATVEGTGAAFLYPVLTGINRQAKKVVFELSESGYESATRLDEDINVMYRIIEITGFVYA